MARTDDRINRVLDATVNPIYAWNNWWIARQKRKGKWGPPA